MDIVSLPIEIDEDMIDSRFRLVVIASQRAKELAFGAKPRVETKFKKIPTLALEETLEGELEFITGEEAKAKLEEARKFDYKRFLEEKRKEAMPEDLSELEKDLKMYLTEKEQPEKLALEELFAEKNDGTEEISE
jgi:DNA-directed RNA polymerase omega subunit